MLCRGETAIEAIEMEINVEEATGKEETEEMRLGPSLGEPTHRWWFPQLLRPLKLLRGLCLSVPRLMAPARFVNKAKEENNGSKRGCWMRGPSLYRTRMTSMTRARQGTAAKLAHGHGLGMRSG